MSLTSGNDSGISLSHPPSLFLPPILPDLSCVSSVHSNYMINAECWERNENVSIHQKAKTLKTDLTLRLQNLSDRAKSTVDYFEKIRLYPNYIKKNGDTFKRTFIEEIDSLILALQNKKQELVEYINNEIERKISLMHQQYSLYNKHIQQTTTFLQYSIELLKQSDPYAYIEEHNSLIERYSYLNEYFSNQCRFKPYKTYAFNLKFNPEYLHQSIQRLKFENIKPPCVPYFIFEQCQYHEQPESDTNSAVILWSIDKSEPIQGFILEMNEGTDDSEFRIVYCGNETVCVIDGLMPSDIYTARIKAYNDVGESQYSECVTLHSSVNLDSFTFHRYMTHPDIKFLFNDYQSITCLSLQDRIALGAKGFRDGVHYWRIVIENYDARSDPAFGVARFDVSKENMLGTDSKSWCMYVDDQRLWFMHNGQHTNRLSYGISIGSTVGVILDLNRGTLSFYINDQSRRLVAFSSLIKGIVYYPAVSLNRYVQLRLISGLDPSLISDKSSLF